jgi:deoxyribose-phosphate aldolase
MSQLNIEDDLLMQLIGLIDLTSLSDDDTPESIRALCTKAITPQGTVACVCVYPQFIPIVKECLVETPVKIAAVSNFPAGGDNIEATTADIAKSISLGANEIDVVMPYQRFLAGDDKFTLEFIQRCKAACGNKAALKVILETGALMSAEFIHRASLIAIKGGADFIKTSTGKINIGATMNAAETMLSTIRDTNPKVGFKASGGIRTVNDAVSYLQLAAEIMGPEWCDANHFRLGASILLDNVITELSAS